jgi:hypothetical protein
MLHTPIPIDAVDTFKVQSNLVRQDFFHREQSPPPTDYARELCFSRQSCRFEVKLR